MPKLILDAMGGDHAPRAVLEGAAQALPELEGELVILGDEKIISPLLQKRRCRALFEAMQGPAPGARQSATFSPKCKVTLIHTPETIAMDDSLRALRRKPHAPINVGCELAAQSYRERARKPDGVAAFVSAGHSGAMMAAALLKMGRLAHVERPAIAVKLPTIKPEGCVLLDVGANVDCKPEHLRDFAVMGALYAQVERKSPGLPKVAVLSNGEEHCKGTELTRAARDLIEGLSCFRPGPRAIGELTGYAEGKDIFKGEVDVMVADGFVGNVVLKSLEGLGNAVMAILKKETKRNFFAVIGAVLSSTVLRRLKRKLDYAEYGAAPLLGVAGYAFICHGRSNPRAIKNALLRAQTTLRERMVERLESALESITVTGEASKS